MTLFEFTQKQRYSALSLANRIVSIWEKEQISHREMRWLQLLSTNSRIKSLLLKKARKYGYSGNYLENHPFLDRAAQCACAYAVLEEVQSLVGQHFIADH